MSESQCLRKGTYEKFSTKKLLKIVKAVKPVLKRITRKQRTNAITPSTCNFDIVESFQNDINESELYRLDFKFFDDSDEVSENLKNEELEKRLLEKLSDEEKPFNEKQNCEFAWAPMPDFDIYKRGDDFVTSRQRAEQQVSLAVN